MYYKVEKGVVSKEPIPEFLKGLKPADLADLSWTDPALGVSEAAWWPGRVVEFDSTTHKATGEVLTPDAELKVVVVDLVAVPFTTKEIATAEAEEINIIRSGMVITMRQCRLALLGAGLLDSVDAALATLPEPDKSAATISWEYGASVERLSDFVVGMGPMLGLSDEEVDALFEGAKDL